MKTIILLFTLIGCAFSTFAVELQLHTEDYYNPLAGMYSQHVYITSMEDHVTLKNVSINRGNCRIGTPPQQYLRTLNFGQKIMVTPIVGCSIIEIKVVTDKGTETYSTQ